MTLEYIKGQADIFNLCWWIIYGGTGSAMAKACKFCVFLNSYVCDNQDCINCGQCKKPGLPA